MKANFAHLKETSPFYALFPGGMVPIKNILAPNVVECEGDGVQDVYMVDLDKLTQEQFSSVVKLVHQQCDPTSRLEDCSQEILERGLPLRAKHVSWVSSNVPFFL